MVSHQLVALEQTFVIAAPFNVSKSSQMLLTPWQEAAATSLSAGELSPAPAIRNSFLFITKILLKLYARDEVLVDSLDFSEDVGLAEEVVLLLVLEVDLGAAEFGKQNLVSDFHAHWDVFASLERRFP
jgi:hypothetical protein